MIIAMITVRMMQMPIHQIADMVAVGHGLVTTTGSMLVVFIVSAALMLRRATVGVGRRDLDYVLNNLFAFDVLKVAACQVVHVILVLNREMAASRAMMMRM